MARKQSNRAKELLQALAGEDRDLVKEIVQATVQEVLEAEMEQFLGAAPYERTATRRGYRAGYYSRKLITRVGTIELRVPQDREGKFSTELFERYQRSEKALVLAVLEMYIQGVSTRRVKKVAEELCGEGFSASTVSRLAKKLDGELERFARRRLEEEYPYLILDARVEKVRVDGVVQSQAVQIAIGVNMEGRRRILAVELADRESTTSWRDFLLRLKQRGLSGVIFVVSDDHEGLKRAISELLPGAVWQRCYVHFLRNARDRFPRKGDEDCLTELRWMYERRDVAEAQRDLAVWLDKWGERYPKLCDWVEENIEETFSFYFLPRAHHKHMKSTNMLERLNEEIRRRTAVVRVFPNEASCLRLVRALAAEIDEEWLEGARYLNMELLREQRRVQATQAEGSEAAA